ncbi:aldehyde dehydrogenase family protein [Trichlorobacter lovleyi]|uniref:Aldehyde Dehydrogenase n=1 Tax=Trichlorobacter lovleyi (strain ATCC BAA-1151 / DSM 17278 / SZ) TaxID=398767 RepID=B3E812_TRIL1|nr:aldehyde dehydrogenase family protein [Trichlorobacter lovleyi]ACD96585.1 Aldehyde Dehydrogenase [Trichlorobacter lovleyi SZ]
MGANAKEVISLMDVPEGNMLEQAQVAAREFAKFSPQAVDKIVEAVAAVAAERSAFYAEWIVRETGYGVVEHKTIKNEGSSAGLVNFYKGQNFCGYEIDTEKKVVKIARPAGVVLALVPSTNPVATTYYKILLSLMSRNAVILCPHPAAKGCIVGSADELTAVAEKAGLPKGVIQVVREPSIALLETMMKSDQVNLILATGGPGVVRAAYSSGNPAIGVGPGNVGHYVDGTGSLDKAALDIAISSGFDNNLGCTSDSVALVERDVADAMLEALSRNGVLKLEDKDDIEKVRNVLYPDGGFNPAAIGKSAAWIANEAGISINEDIKILCVEVDKIDDKDIYTREKLFPVLGFLRIDGLDAAYRAAEAMIAMGGAGHTAAIHSKDSDKIVAWSQLPVYRIATNGPAPLVASGFASGLAPTMTVGTGFFGRSSVCENVGPQHLIHWTQIAYSDDPSEVLGDIEDAMTRWDKSRSA